MSDATKIQWCHSTVNPIMGCRGCELFPAPGKVLGAIDTALYDATGWKPGTSADIFRRLIGSAYARIARPLPGHSEDLSTTNLYHLRQEFVSCVQSSHGRNAAKLAKRAIEAAVKCYAAVLHLNKARSIANPTRSANSGYAPVFEHATRFPGRVRAMAGKSDLRGVKNAGKPWLDGCPRLIFVSDMGDAFSREEDFGFLETEVIEPILSKKGLRHWWLWLTKRPGRMARFSRRIGGFPPNVCAMTTVTAPGTLGRIDQLRGVRASVRGLSIEPLLDHIPANSIDLTGVSWVIVGGESGPRDRVRPFHLSWARELRDHCAEKGVAFYLKQLGRRPFDGDDELLLGDTHGGDWDEWPSDLKIRQVPAQFLRQIGGST